MGVNGLTPRPSRFTPGKEKKYPPYRRLGGQFWKAAENFSSVQNYKSTRKTVDFFYMLGMFLPLNR